MANNTPPLFKPRRGERGAARSLVLAAWHSPDKSTGREDRVARRPDVRPVPGECRSPALASLGGVRGRGATEQSRGGSDWAAAIERRSGPREADNLPLSTADYAGGGALILCFFFVTHTRLTLLLSILFLFYQGITCHSKHLTISEKLPSLSSPSARGHDETGSRCGGGLLKPRPQEHTRRTAGLRRYVQTCSPDWRFRS